MTDVKSGDRVVVSVIATSSGDLQVVSTPVGFQGIISKLFAENDTTHGFLRHEDGEQWEVYDFNGADATSLLQIAALTGTVTLSRPTRPYDSSKSDGSRIDLGTGTHTFTISFGAGSMERILRELNPFWKNLTSGDASPDIGNYRWLKTQGSTAITRFDSLTGGQRFLVRRGNADITIVHDGTNIDLFGGENVTLTAANPAIEFAVEGTTARQITGALAPIDEDDFASDSATRAPSQQSVKAYVDSVARGLGPKQAVKAASTANITLSGPQTLDGVSVTAGDRVLVKNQSTASQNGVYNVAAGAWTRASDFDAWSEVPSAYVMVTQGSTQAETGWVCTSDAGGTIGVTAINFVQFSGSAAYVENVIEDGVTTRAPSQAAAKAYVDTLRTDVAATTSGKGAAQVGYKATGSSVDQTVAQKLGRRVFADDFCGTPDGTIDNASGIQAAIDWVAALGGGEVFFPSPIYRINSALIIKKGVKLRGVGPIEVIDTNAPYMRGSIIKAGAAMAAMITQADITSPLHSIALEHICLDANAANYAVTRAVYLSCINSRIQFCAVENGTGDGIYIKANATAAWINWINNNQVSGFAAGSGIYFEGSDSWICDNYVSGNLVGINVPSSGGIRICRNQVEVSSSFGMILKSSPVTYECLDQVSDNYFDLNAKSLHIARDATNSAITGAHIIANNRFHRCTTGHIDVDSNVNQGVLIGNEFEGSGSYDVTFGSGCARWTLINSHERSATSRFVNLPGDTTMIVGGYQPAAKLQNLVLSDTYNTATAQLDVYANKTTLGYANTNSRFGMAQNVSGFDAALLVRTPNGNSIALDVADGETTTVTEFNFGFRGSNFIRVNEASGLRLRPRASVTPPDNGDLAFEATDNTTLKLKYKGSDGTVRSVSLTLS